MTCTSCPRTCRYQSKSLQPCDGLLSVVAALPERLAGWLARQMGWGAVGGVRWWLIRLVGGRAGRLAFGHAAVGGFRAVWLAVCSAIRVGA